MASRLQGLLGVAPLEMLKKKRGQGTPSMNTDLQNQVGFSQGGLAPLNQVNPLQPTREGNYQQNQMKIRGFETPLLDVDSSFISGMDNKGIVGGISGEMGGDYGQPEGGTTEPIDKFYTKYEDMLSNFLSAMPSEEGQTQLLEFLGEGGAGGTGLTLEEFGALMGFDIRHIEANTQGIKDRLRPLYEEYQAEGHFSGLEEELRNAQAYRGDLFGTVTDKSELEAASILNMTQAGSATGLVSGRRREVMEEGLQTLDEVLRKQLVDAESQYFGQLEGVFKSYVTDFQDTLKSERDKLLEEHSGFTDLLNYYTTSSVEGAQDWNIGTVKSEITSTANQTWQDIWTDFVNAGGSVELQNWFDSQYNANPSWSPSLAQIVAWMSNWLDSGYGDG